MSEGGDRVRIAFIGCVVEGRRSLEALLDLGEEVAAVFTLTPELAARTSGAVAWEDVCQREEIPLHYVRKMHDPDATAAMRTLAPDLVFCVGWTQLLRRELLELPRLGCIGFHASMLPKYRGRAPVNWAIIRGEHETGNSMIVLDEGVDTGDIVAQRRIEITDEDTCATVYAKVAASEVDMLGEMMPLIHAGRMPRLPQDHSRATALPRRRPEDGIIDWSATTDQLYDWVRALTHPYPGAFTHLPNGETLWVWRASRWRPHPTGPQRSEPAPGWLRMGGNPPRLLAGTGDGDLCLDVVELGGVEMPGPALAGSLPGLAAGGVFLERALALELA